MTVGGFAQICVYKNKNTCGEVWNLGASEAKKLGYDYVHMTADDLVPHSGWYETAVETVEAGYLPGALVYDPDGTIHPFANQVQEEWSTLKGASVPFCRTEDWIDIPPIHYYSDNAYDLAQVRVNNKRIVARREYAFTHYTAQAGRKSIGPAEKHIYEEWAKTL